MVLPVSYLPHPERDLQAEAGRMSILVPPGGGLPSPFTGPCGWPKPLVLNREEQKEGQGWSHRVLTWALPTNSHDAPGRILSHRRSHGPSVKGHSCPK